MESIPTLTTADEVRDLPRGRVFRVTLPGLSWADTHRILYFTANREVRLVMANGTLIDGVLDETPSYFERDRRVWLRIKGRKTRKGIKVSDIVGWSGFRAPTLAEALTAYAVLNSGNPSDDQVAEARSVAADM